MTRERNARLVELFVTARDAALDVGVSTGQLKPTGKWGQPFYISKPDAGRGLRQLVADFPANVATGREFQS